MIIFKRQIAHKSVEIPLYSEDEAKEKGFHPIPWREAFGLVQKGDWVISDDGFCAEVMDAQATYIRTTAGYVNKSAIRAKKGAKHAFNAQNRIKTKSWNSFVEISRRERTLKPKRVRDALTYIAAADLARKPADLEFAGRMAFPWDKKPLWGMRRILAWKETQQMIKNLAKEILIKMSLTEDEVMKLYQETIQLARERKDPNALLKVADTLAEFHELKRTAKSGHMLLPPWGVADDLADPELLKRVEEAKGQLAEATSKNELEPLSDDERLDPTSGDDDYVKPQDYLDGLAKGG